MQPEDWEAANSADLHTLGHVFEGGQAAIRPSTTTHNYFNIILRAFPFLDTDWGIVAATAAAPIDSTLLLFYLLCPDLAGGGRVCYTSLTFYIIGFFFTVWQSVSIVWFVGSLLRSSRFQSTFVCPCFLHLSNPFFRQLIFLYFILTIHLYCFIFTVYLYSIHFIY